mmetsp:Transcript_77237/g.184960  ORF Transcript_77237/g.184960 Transcript_77237/m.184960 type:complete len:204 (-) Transcript_77237:1427-2038(-)
MHLSRKTLTTRTRRMRRQNRRSPTPGTSALSEETCPNAWTATSARPENERKKSNQLKILSLPQKNTRRPKMRMRSTFSSSRATTKITSSTGHPSHASKPGWVWKPIMTPLSMMRAATKGSINKRTPIFSGGAARSLMRTKVSSATKRLVSPARRISRIASNCVCNLEPKILRCTSASCTMKTSINACNGTTLYLRCGFPSTLP